MSNILYWLAAIIIGMIIKDGLPDYHTTKNCVFSKIDSIMVNKSLWWNCDYEEDIILMGLWKDDAE